MTKDGVEGVAVGARVGAARTEWAALYEEHAPALARFLTKLVGDQEVAVELMQEAFVRAIRGGHDPRGLRSSRAWLFRIAANLGHDHRRRRALLRFIPFSGREVDPAAMPDPDTALVQRTLRALPVAQATTLLLHYDAGFSRREIAEMDGVSEEAVKSRLARGRDAFIREFARAGGDRP